MMELHVLPCAMVVHATSNTEVVLSILLFVGGQELQIGISQFASYRDSDIKVQIGDSWPQIQAQTDHSINVMLPALAAGWYNVSVTIDGVAVSSNGYVNMCTLRYTFHSTFCLVFQG